MNAVVTPTPVAQAAMSATLPPSVTPASKLDRAVVRDLRERIEEFHCEYAAVLDRGAVEAWPAFFTDDAYYRVIARDNLESNLPLGLMLCEGMGMLKDRAFAIAHTEMFAPRYVQHHISLIRVTGIESGGPEELIIAQANYLVYETLIDEPTCLLQAGKYRDKFVLRGETLLLKERECVFDSVLVPNCVVYPI